MSRPKIDPRLTAFCAAAGLEIRRGSSRWVVYQGERRLRTLPSNVGDCRAIPNAIASLRRMTGFDERK